MWKRAAPCLTVLSVLTGAVSPAAAQAVVATPPSLDVDMDTANGALIDVQYCARRTKEAGWVATSEALTDRYSDIDDRASGLFGLDIDQPPLKGWTRPLCTEPVFHRWTVAAGEALDRVEATLAPIEQGMGAGLWLGAFPVCADIVVSAEQRYAYDAGSFVELTLKPEAADALAAYDRKFGAKSTRVKLSGAWVPAWFVTDIMRVRLDGKTISARVNKEPFGTGFKIYGRQHTSAIAAAAKAACNSSVGGT